MNAYDFVTVSVPLFVLIDTWWNVNEFLSVIDKYFTGFNRYMVECESVYRTSTFADNKVLIDTWWNVNINFSGKMAQMSTVLIDTWWNVNKIKAKVFEEGKAF